jgi:DNA-binding protein H-NS
MTTYADVKKQIAQLEKKAADLRKAEVAKVVANIRDQMAKYELTVEDIAPGKSSRGRKKATKGTTAKTGKPAKYMDPKTGKTWTGHGKAPGWIAAATKAGRRDDFLIEKVNQAKPAEKSKPAKPVVSKKAPTAAKKVAPKIPKAQGRKLPSTIKASVAKKKPTATKTKPASQAMKVETKAPAKSPAKVKSRSKPAKKPASTVKATKQAMATPATATSPSVAT